MAKIHGFISALIILLVGCGIDQKDIYHGRINTDNSIIPVENITLYSRSFDAQGNILRDKKVHVGLLKKYTIKRELGERYLSIYIQNVEALKEESEPFITDNLYLVDYDLTQHNILPVLSISSPVQIIGNNAVGSEKIIEWREMKNVDYYRIDMFVADNDVPCSLYFIPNIYTYMNKKMIESAVIQSDPKQIFEIGKQILVLHTLDKNMFQLDDFTSYCITAFRTDKKSEHILQVSLPTMKHIFIK